MSSGASAPNRLMNTLISPFWGMVKKNTPQGAVYNQGQELPPGLEGGFPTWIPIEFPAIAGFDTVDSVINLPDGFTLLSFIRYVSAAGGAAVQFYDEVRQIWLTSQLVDSFVIAGSLGKTLIQMEPYTFPDENSQLFVRVVNQDSGVNDVMIALYGVIGGAKS